MFIVGGFNAYPAEIENALLRHPGHPPGRRDRRSRRASGRGGHGLRGHRTRRARHRSTTSSRGARDQMANYKVPRAVEIVDELPRTPPARCQKDVLRQRAAPARRRELAGMRSAEAPAGLTSLAKLRVVELGVWVAAPVRRRAAGRLGRRCDQGRAAERRPDALRLRFAGHRHRRPEPRIRAGQPGQAQRSARPASRGQRAAPSRICWRPPTCSSPTCGPTRSTGSDLEPERLGVAGTPASSTAASAATGSAARIATGPPTTWAHSGPAPACRSSWPTAAACR